jgi:hypothetical protein
MVRLVALLACAVLAAGAAAGGAAMAATTTPRAPGLTATTPVVADGPQQARLGFGSRGFGSRRTYSRRPTIGYRPRARRGRGFLRGLFHGLFWGWLLSHFFGGGFPLVLPLLALVFLLMATRRRRPPMSHRW